MKHNLSHFACSGGYFRYSLLVCRTFWEPKIHFALKMDSNVCKILLVPNDYWNNTANWTCDWLQNYNWQVMAHHPYSPCMVPRDFHAFELHTKHLADKWFATDSKARCHLLLTDNWKPFFLSCNTSLGSVVRQVLKCQWWLHRSLACTVCCQYVTDTMKFE
jgi:hypothetical protein